MTDLKQYQLFYDEITSMSGSNSKKEYLKQFIENEIIKNLLLYTYNPYFQYNIKNIKVKTKFKLNQKSEYKSLIHLLNDVLNKSINGDGAMEQLCIFIENNKQYEKLIKCILSKNLKIGIAIKQINVVIPSLIPTFEVSLGVDFIKGRKHFDKGGEWYYSRKLDGYRLIVVLKKNKIKFYSRVGKEPVCNLKLINDELFKHINYFIDNKIEILDGELCVLNKDNSDDFKGIQTQFTKKNHLITNASFNIFDGLTLKEFSNQISDNIFSERYQKLKNVFDNIKFNKIHLVKQGHYTENGKNYGCYSMHGEIREFERWFKDSLDKFEYDDKSNV